MKVVLVDPISSGVNLAEAFRERGIEPYHVYRSPVAAAYAADPGVGGKLLHETFDATCGTLKELGAQAVLAASETGVDLADRLSAALGLPHNAPELAQARDSKLLEARALQAAGVPVAQTESVSDLADVAATVARFERFPIVVKPVASAGSDGLAICADAAEAERAVAELLGHRCAVGSINESVLLQEYLSGKQYYFNTVSVGGRHVLSDVFVSRFDERMGKPILRNQVSLRTLGADERAVVEYGLRCLDALGVRFGAAHMEIRLTPTGPRLIETNFRLMGPLVPADPFVSALGYSAATLWADAVLGNPAFDEHAARTYAPRGCLGFAVLRPREAGVLLEMPGLDQIRRLPTFHSFAKLPRLGFEIADPLMTTCNGGVAYFTGPDADAIQRDMDATSDLEDRGDLYRTSGSTVR